MNNDHLLQKEARMMDVKAACIDGGICCMVHSALVFRNLKVYTEKLPFTEMKMRSKA